MCVSVQGRIFMRVNMLGVGLLNISPMSLCWCRRPCCLPERLAGPVQQGCYWTHRDWRVVVHWRLSHGSCLLHCGQGKCGQYQPRSTVPPQVWFGSSCNPSQESEINPLMSRITVINKSLIIEVTRKFIDNQRGMSESPPLELRRQTSGKSTNKINAMKNTDMWSHVSRWN